MKAGERPTRADARSAGAGAELTIVKLRADGSEAARYPGRVIPSPPAWVAVRASWGYPRMDLGYVVYEPGDIFYEYFSLDRPFNAFAVFASDGTFKGWYCNVTYPSWIEGDTLFWRDLYVDVIAYPDGRTEVLDEDELAEAGLAEHDPALHQTILAARDTLLAMISTAEYPFSVGT